MSELVNGTAISSLLTASAWSFGAVLRVSSINYSTATKNANGDAVFMDTNGKWGIHLTSSGGNQIYVHQYDGADKSVAIPISLGVDLFFHATYDGTTLRAGVNCVWATGVLTGNISDTTGTLLTGYNANQSTGKNFDGEIVLAFTQDSVISDADFLRVLREIRASTGDVLPGSYALSVADTAAISDALVRSLGTRLRTIADTIASSETLTRSKYPFARANADTGTVAETIARTKSAARAPSDTAVTSDSSVRSRTVERSLSDTVVVSDALAGVVPTFRRTFTDAATTSDTATLLVPTFRRTVNDTASASDASTPVVPTFRRSPSDTAVASDALVRFYVKERDTVDAVAATDTVEPIVYGWRKTFNDVIGLSDSFDNTETFSRGGDDDLAVSDSFRRLVPTFRRTLSDAPVASDVTLRWLASQRKDAETATISDVGKETVLRDRARADTAASTDVLKRTAFKGRILADSPTATDTVSTALYSARVAQDTSAISDACARTATFGRLPADSPVTSDTLTRIVTTFHRAIDDDDVGTNDSLTLDTKHLFQRIEEDTLDAIESFNRLVPTFHRRIADVVDIADTQARDINGTSSVADLIFGIADTLHRGIAKARKPADAAVIADIFTGTETSNRYNSDSTVVADASLREKLSTRSNSDSASSADTFTLAASYVRPAADGAQATDAISHTLYRLETTAVAESMTADDIALGTVTMGRLFADSFVVPGDHLVKDKTFGRDAHDLLRTDDLFRPANDVSRELLDTFRVVDTAAIRATSLVKAKIDVRVWQNARITMSVSRGTEIQIEIGQGAPAEQVA